MLRDLLYEENSFGVFVLVTVVLGGGAAWLAGRAVASMWSRGWLVLFYALLIGERCGSFIFLFLARHFCRCTTTRSTP